MTHPKIKIEYGDFQTPLNLANDIAKFLKSIGIAPAIIVEPNCGLGNFVQAAHSAFPCASRIFAFDINRDYIQNLHEVFVKKKQTRIHISRQDFFEMDWKEFFNQVEGEILILGNPPWATNSALGVLYSTNLPEKSNILNHNGFAAKTGKANFDISEWMLIKLLNSLINRRSCIAMLCKTTVARKVLKYAWLNRMPIGKNSIHLIDAKTHFGASVAACLLIIHTGFVDLKANADVYSDLSFNDRISKIGLSGKELIANLEEYTRLKDFDGQSYYKWRSGIKHDAFQVMEFTRESHHYRNGLREKVAIEDIYLFPLLKSSNLANGKLTPSKFVLLTQRHPSDDTSIIEDNAPKTWHYLITHADILDGRRSIIYQKRPRFSVFGIGNYTFAHWKVAVSGFYKNLRFQVIGPFCGKPCVVDDTCYFIPCESKVEAIFMSNLLNSDPCLSFLQSLIFFDAKRPITIDILNTIDFKRLADHLGIGQEAQRFLKDAQIYESKQSLLVFEKQARYLNKHSRR